MKPNENGQFFQQHICPTTSEFIKTNNQANKNKGNHDRERRLEIRYLNVG